VYFLSVVFQNDVNSRPMQASVHINNTVNYNIACPVLPSNNNNSSNIDMNVNMNENNAEENEEDENDNNESDQGSDTDVKDTDLLTPPTSDDDE